MTVPLIVHPEAGREIEQARSWYDGISPALGNDFAQAAAEAIDLIRRHPRLYADIGDGLHRALLRRFPYQVYYRIGSGGINVLSVHHSHADPETVRDRASRRQAMQ
jgi:plasmid stabilization system protein ParE